MTQYPIFIITRDRLDSLLQLVAWLEKAGQERIIFVDNDSTYPPLTEYLEFTGYSVVNLSGNYGHTSPWTQRVIETCCGDDEYFVVTDPDVVPAEEAPLDSIDFFRSLLDKYLDRTKIGFGLKLDDLPDHYQFKQEVIQYESRFHDYYRPEPSVYFAPIDTTFALYRPGASPDISYSGRTDEPYVARHLSWYVDSANLTDEEKYYREHMHTGINSWNQDKVPWWWH
jgi:hypothetical protein